MTATATSLAPVLAPVDETQPQVIARRAARFSLGLAFFMSFSGNQLRPTFAILGLMILGGAMLLLPRPAVMRMPVPLLPIAIVAYAAASYGWSVDTQQTIFMIRFDLVLTVTMIAAPMFLPIEAVTRTFVRVSQFIVAWSLWETITNPGSRVNGVDGYPGQTVTGWHGIFMHKNQMTPFLAIALTTILIFEPRRWVKVVSVAAILILLAGSHSTTGLAAVVAVFGLSAWFAFYRKMGVRDRGSFVVSSVMLGITGIIAVALSLTSLANAYGKDATFTGRTDIWRYSIDAIRDEPWFGYGLSGPFINIFTPVGNKLFREVGFFIAHAHNGFLDLWLRLGIIGVVMVGALGTITFFAAWRLPRRHIDVTQWIVTICTVQMLISFSESVFFSPWIGVICLFRVVTLRLRNDVRR